VLKRYKDDDLPAFCGIDLTDVNQVGLFGERPLCVAATRGDIQEIYGLLSGGADIDAPGELGNTALHEAVSQGHVSAVKLLFECGARIDLRNQIGDTALDIARLRNREELVAALQGGE
jgi:ankyrin repeat protein